MTQRVSQPAVDRALQTRAQMPTGYTSTSTKMLVICSALTLLLFASHVLNNSLFPHVALIFPAGREISTYCGVVFSVVVALLAYRHPAMLRETPWSLGCLGVFGVSILLLVVGVQTNNNALVLLGSPFGGIGAIWFSVLMGLALIELGTERALIVIPTAFVMSFVLELVFDQVLNGASVSISGALYFVCVALTYVLIRTHIRTMLANIQTSQPPRVLDVTNPLSFLPFSSPVLVLVFLFNTAFGFVFTHQIASVQSTPLINSVLVLSFVPVAAVFLLVIVARERFSADYLYYASTLLVFAGYLLLPLSLVDHTQTVPPDIAQALLAGGSSCFSILTYYVICAVGSKNRIGAFLTAALLTAASWLGIGIGTMIGQITSVFGAQSVTAAVFTTALMGFVFMAYNFLIARTFSFKATIDEVLPLKPTTLPQPTDTAATSDTASSGTPDQAALIDQACAQLAQEAGLTPREGEILQLLARGRTSIVIQEKLVLSHNTVKTHVHHIYEKLHVHSQQELIDQVERLLP